MEATTILTEGATIARWLWPDYSRGKDTSLSKARKAISDYKKAVGKPEDLAELMTFYCEQAAGFGHAVGLADERFFNSLMAMFTQALKVAITLAPVQRDSLLERLVAVTEISRDFGYGLGEEMSELLNEHRSED